MPAPAYDATAIDTRTLTADRAERVPSDLAERLGPSQSE